MKHPSQRRYRKLFLILAAVIALALIVEFLIRKDVLYNSLASMMYNWGKADQAAALWEARLDPEDGDPVPEANYAKNDYKKGRYSQAGEYISSALTDDPENPILNYDKGNTQYRENELDPALESYKKAMLADPNDQDAKSNYELVLNRKGYKKPTKEDQEQQEEEQPRESRNEYENTLDALDQKESNDRQQPARPQEEPSERWW